MNPIAAILGSVFLLAGADAAVKAMSAEFSLWQIYVTRSLVALPILLVILAASGTRPWRGVLSPWVALRSLLLSLMWLAYYAALPVMDLAVAATALYTTPVLIAVLASLVAADPVGRAGWIAVVLGFAGVVVAIGPSGDAITAWAILPLLSAVLYASAAIVTRTRCADESPVALALALHVALLLTGLIGTAGIAILRPEGGDPFLFGSWTAMGTGDGLLMAALGGIMVVVAIGVAYAYQRGRAAVIGAFDYGYLVFAAFWGALLFGERPSLMTFIGMAMIALAGALVLFPDGFSRYRFVTRARALRPDPPRRLPCTDTDADRSVPHAPPATAGRS